MKSHHAGRTIKKNQHFLKIASIIRNNQNAPWTSRNDVIEPLGCIRTHRNNCRNFQISQNVQIKIGPNMVTEQWQTISDHQSEARKKKLDRNKTDNSPGVTLSSWFWWSKLAMNTHSAHIVSTPLRAHMSQPGAENKGECFAPPTDPQASRTSQPVRLQTVARLLSNHWSHPICCLETETPGNHYVAARTQHSETRQITPDTSEQMRHATWTSDTTPAQLCQHQRRNKFITPGKPLTVVRRTPPLVISVNHEHPYTQLAGPVVVTHRNRECQIR